MKTLPLAPTYRQAVMDALAVQFVLTLVLTLILDGGRLARVGACAMAGFWVGAAMIMMRRPREAGILDLLYIRLGYLLMLVAGVLLDVLGPHFRG